jgi:hypothetical protein
MAGRGGWQYRRACFGASGSACTRMLPRLDEKGWMMRDGCYLRFMIECELLDAKVQSWWAISSCIRRKNEEQLFLERESRFPRNKLRVASPAMEINSRTIPVEFSPVRFVDAELKKSDGRLELPGELEASKGKAAAKR